jgi:uncharacterized protein (DUF1684 family)
MTPLVEFRAEVDDFMQFHPQSPLAAEQREAFEGLPYYDENDALIVVVRPQMFPEEEPLVELTTNTGEIRPHRRWARFTFVVDGQEAALTIYSDPAGEELFLPFKDATNGRETYGAGRYLDDNRPGLRRLVDGRLEVDFNYAYNPYCAYSPAYSCPLPPAENWLSIPIAAGEKKYK